MKHRLVAAIAASAAVLLTYAGSATAGSTELKPAQLERGADPAIPYVIDFKVLVDGDVRIKFANNVFLHGKSGDDYVVTTLNQDTGATRTQRVSPTGERTVLASGTNLGEMVLSTNGSRLAAVHGGNRSSTLTVYNTVTGAKVHTKSLPYAWVQALDFHGDRLVLSTFTSWATRTWIYSLRDGFRRVVVHKAGSLADFGSDRIAYYTADPYEGGCLKLAKLSDASQVIWRSCSDRIAALSPDASRMATIHILSDGIGPNRVTVRGPHGGALATYTANWFGNIEWETNRALLLDTNGTDYAATVRCTPTGCERATKLSPVQEI